MLSEWLTDWLSVCIDWCDDTYWRDLQELSCSFSPRLFEKVRKHQIIHSWERISLIFWQRKNIQWELWWFYDIDPLDFQPLLLEWCCHITTMAFKWRTLDHKQELSNTGIQNWFFCCCWSTQGIPFSHPAGGGNSNIRPKTGSKWGRTTLVKPTG